MGFQWTARHWDCPEWANSEWRNDRNTFKNSENAGGGELCPPRKVHEQHASNSVHLLYIAWMSRRVIRSSMWEQPQSAALWEKEVDNVCTHCQHLRLDHGRHCHSCGSGHWVTWHILGSCEWNICTQAFFCFLHGITDTPHSNILCRCREFSLRFIYLSHKHLPTETPQQSLYYSFSFHLKTTVCILDSPSITYLFENVFVNVFLKSRLFCAIV